LEPTSILTATFGAGGVALAGAGETDTIDLTNALAVLERLQAARCIWEARRACSGNPRQAWGHRKKWKGAQEHLSGVTKERQNFVSDCCHAWSRRMAARAEHWRCGAVKLVHAETLAGHPFPWTLFSERLRYKLEEIGSSLTT